MGLFSKKYCDICGNEIKLLGNRKLDDGNMCKNCAAKLSPWFSGRRHTSVKDIKAQLAYRQENEKQLDGFHPTKTIGKRYKVYIDEDKQTFIVTNATNYKTTNPDLIALSAIQDVIITIDEDRDEIYDKDAEGNKISFDPPKYEYEYQFDVKILVDHPYFDDISFELTTDNPEEPDSELYKSYVAMAQDLMQSLVGKDFVEDRSNFKYPIKEEEKTETTTESNEWYCTECGTKNSGNFCSTCGHAKPIIFKPYFCASCGTKIESAEMKFCPTCGNKLKD